MAVLDLSRTNLWSEVLDFKLVAVLETQADQVRRVVFTGNHLLVGCGDSLSVDTEL